MTTTPDTRNLPAVISTVLLVTLTRGQFLGLERVFRAFFDNRPPYRAEGPEYTQLWLSGFIEPARAGLLHGWIPTEQAQRAFQLVDWQGNVVDDKEPGAAEEGFLRPVTPSWSTQRPADFVPTLPPARRMTARVVDPTIGLVAYVDEAAARRAAELDEVAELYREGGGAWTVATLVREKEAQRFGGRTLPAAARRMVRRTAIRWALNELGDCLPVLRPHLGKQWLIDAGLPELADYLSDDTADLG